MKRFILFIMVLSSTVTFAQNETADESLAKIKGHEIGVNLLDFISASAVEVQYEHYFANNQSAQISFTAFDNYGYHELDYYDENNTHSLALAYKFYMGKKNHAGVFFFPYFKYMFGTQTYENYYYYDEETGTDQRRDYEFDMNNLSFGIGLGYKWVFAKHYTLSTDFTLGRTFNEDLKERYSDVEFKSGITFGYRF